ncbi:MAG: hypothetical protein LBL23_01335 [Coriobacteriales bacterium]|jgi:hypothetical protein|nr:hypothetical protein [Coriobacteriales bacterium]
MENPAGSPSSSVPHTEDAAAAHLTPPAPELPDASSVEGESEELMAVIIEDPAQAKRAQNKAKRDAKRERRRAADRAEAELRAQKRQAEREKAQAFKASIVDGYVVDGNGRRLRRYTRAERFFDNKPLCYGLLITFIVLACIFVFLRPF